jgi:hypothetical protein
VLTTCDLTDLATPFFSQVAFNACHELNPADTFGVIWSPTVVPEEGKLQVKKDSREGCYNYMVSTLMLKRK